MELDTKLAELSKVVREPREVLLTEEAAKNALVMPFLQALGYNVFNPAEVIPEFKKLTNVDFFNDTYSFFFIATLRQKIFLDNI